MIGMFVRDQDGVDVFEVFADRGQAFAELLHAEPGVDQDARIFGGQQRGVARTAARQHTELYDGPPP